MSLIAPASNFHSDGPLVLSRMKSRAAALADHTGFVLLLLTVSVLLIRPADLLPVLGGAPFYEILVIACIFVSLPRLAEQLTLRSLQGNSITTLVLLLIPSVMFSHLAALNTYDARLGGAEVGKAFVFFLLVVGLVDSPKKLRLLLLVVVACIFVEALLAVLQYKGALHLAALESVTQADIDPDTNESVLLVRICGIGVFNDPNDFSLIIVVAMVMCVYGMGELQSRWARLLLLGPMALFGYALMLTHSRGGILASIAALVVFLLARFGWRNTLPLACVLIPVLIIPFSGRQTQVDLDNPEDTFQTRLDLWSKSIDAFRSAPVFGIGQGKLLDLIGHVSHNSYLHAFAEMGFLGGAVFVGAFYLTLRGLSVVKPCEPSLRRLRPYLLALVASYAVGLLSLSRCYTVPTQLILSLGTAYLVIAARNGSPAIPKFDGVCIRRVAIAGVVVLVGSYVFMRLMLERGGL